MRTPSRWTQRPQPPYDRGIMVTSLATSLRRDRVGTVRIDQTCSLPPATPIADAITRMADQSTSCALVMDGQELVGIFTERDFLNRVVAAGIDVQSPIAKVMTPSPTTVDDRASVQTAIELMQAGGYRHLPVTDEDGRVLGVLSVRDVVHYLVEYFPANIYNLPPTPEDHHSAREGA